MSEKLQHDHFKVAVKLQEENQSYLQVVLIVSLIYCFYII